MGGSRERTFISTGQPPHRSARTGFSDPGVAKGIRVTEFDPNPNDPRPAQWSNTARAGVLVLVDFKGYRDAP